MENNMIELRKKLEQMTKEQLTGILQSETEKETPDDDLVLLILDILEKRDASRPVELGWKGKAAWREYLAKARKRVRPASYWGRRIAAAAASLVLVLMLVFAALPQEAKAGGIFDVIERYTHSILEFFGSSSDETMQLEYEFRTENPGLQKLRDTMVEYGVTGPSVPMWIPEEYDELIAIEIDEGEKHACISAVFTDGNKYFIVKMSIYDTVEPRGVYKDLPDPQKLEFFGTTHYYVRNLERYTAVWERDNIAGCITLDCQEDILHKILKSIYVLEAI